MPASEEQWLLVQALGGLAVTSVFATARAQEAGAPVQEEEEEEEELEEIIVDATGEARTEEVEVDAAGSAGAPGQAAEEVTPEQLEAQQRFFNELMTHLVSHSTPECSAVLRRIAESPNDETLMKELSEDCKQEANQLAQQFTRARQEAAGIPASGAAKTGATETEPASSSLAIVAQVVLGVLVLVLGVVLFARHRNAQYERFLAENPKIREKRARELKKRVRGDAE